MALRKIRIDGDEILRKVCRPVETITPKILTLIEDMIDTMYEANGVGLAAPQIGILKRVVVIDVGDGPVVMINPEIIEKDGNQEGQEGCLSVPGKVGIVNRPFHVVAKAINEKGEEFIVEGEELMARAICHELDHLDGKLYTDIATEISTEDE
ncbi:MAG: peptide deformylase [Vallitaleaceae bacterium]|nr:peptide deformylase [Vallitaleaceae bacterium]